MISDAFRERFRAVREWRQLGVLLQLSWVLALSVLAPLGLGIWLDRSFQSSPLFLFAGAILGIIAGTIGAVRIATRAIDAVEKARAPKPNDADRKEDRP